MERKQNSFTRYLNEKLKLHLAISLGAFLFILFFQPFSLEKLDFNNRLIFIAGLAGILFLFLFIVQLVLYSVIRRIEGKDPESPSMIADIVFTVLSSVAISFYLRYVGSHPIGFFTVFKVVLICFIPLVIIRMSYRFRVIRSDNDMLLSQLGELQKQVDLLEDDKQNTSIELLSENNNEKLNLLTSDIICIQSADNYVSVIFREGDSFRKMLMRNTLKNLELQLKPYAAFLRCHRTSIVNIAYIEKLASNYGNHWLTLKLYPEKVPVSRQYLVKLKEVL